jgi:hypothetical protein
MNRFAAFWTAMVLTSGVACAADTHESLIREVIAAIKEGTGVLKTVKDDKTAKEATPKVAKVVEHLRDIKKRMEKIGKPTPEQQEELKKKFPERDLSFKEFSEELKRVEKVPGTETIIKLFQGAIK